MRILALDMATVTGWALHDPKGPLLSGVAAFRKRRGETNGVLFLRFRGWLRELLDDTRPEVVAYERPHTRGGHATDLLVGLQTELLSECARRDLEVMPKHSAAIKKHATGRGNANKAAMLAAARERWGERVEDDNEADALHLLDLVREEVGA